MTTQRQIDANKRNALRSTGPRTSVGKAIVAINALRTGLHATRYLVLASLGETAADYEAHTSAIVVNLGPVGPVEQQIAVSIASLLWRIRRIPHFEVAASQPAADLPSHPDRVAPFCSLTLDRPAPTAPPSDHLARVRSDLRFSQTRRVRLLAALARLQSRSRDLPRDLEFGFVESAELREAANLARGWTVFESEPWYDLARQFGLEIQPEKLPPWTHSLLMRAFDHLASQKGIKPAAFRRSVRKQLTDLIAQQDKLIVERQALEENLISEMMIERDRASAVTVYGAEGAIAGIQRSEQHLTRQIERHLTMLEKLQTRRRRIEPPLVRPFSEPLQLAGRLGDRPGNGFVFPPPSLKIEGLPSHHITTPNGVASHVPISVEANTGS